MKAGAASSSFQVSFPGQPSAFDALGLWQPDQRLETTPIRASAIQEPIGCIYRADLPQESSESMRLLWAHAEQLRLSDHALPAARQSLMQDLSHLQNRESGASFSAEPTGVSIHPDSPQGILAMAAQQRWPEVSFNLLDQAKLASHQVEEAAREVQSFSTLVHSTLQQAARVETSAAGDLLAVSHVNFSGDLHTWWQADVSAFQISQHKQVLAQALSTRLQWAKMMLLVATGTVKVASALATGPFNPLAIWATWNYIKRMVEQLQQLRMSTQA